MSAYTAVTIIYGALSIAAQVTAITYTALTRKAKP
jgi:hypothetical protein